MGTAHRAGRSLPLSSAGNAALMLLGGLIASAPAHADELVQQGLKASRVPQWSSVPVRLSVPPSAILS